MTAPERIWAWEYDGAKGAEGQWRGSRVSAITGSREYILATPAALAASPEVQALIADAVKAAVMKSARVRLNKPDKAPNGHYYGTYALGWAAAAKKLRAAIRAGTEGGE